MENQVKNKREWVKNAIIIFLVIMLILTFFSNTIMNLSVPEVTTAYIQSGTITEQVRGTGYVEAADPFKVVAQENRKIASVAVKDGDHVEKDDVIFVLEEQESDEIAELQEKIDDAELQYYLTLLSGEMTGAAAGAAAGGNIASFGDSINSIKAYDDAIAAAEASIAVAQAGISSKMAESAGMESQVSGATEEKKQAEAEKEQLQIKFENEKNAKSAEYANKIAELNSQIEELKSSIAGSSSVTTEKIVTALEGLKTAIKSGMAPDEPGAADDIVVDSGASVETLSNVYSVIKGKASKEIKETDAYKQAVAAVDKALNDYYNSMGSTKSLDSLYSELEKYTAIKAANDAGTFAGSQDYNAAMDKINQADSNITQTNMVKSDLEAAIKGDEGALERSKEYLEQLKSDRAQLITDTKGSLSAESYSKKLDSMKERLEKLKANAYEGTVTAPISGTVKELTLTAGESTVKDHDMFVIIPDGKGLILKIVVTSEQAAKVKKGDAAELPWRFENGECIVESVMPEPESNGKNKIITFRLNVEEEMSQLILGQNMTVTVGNGSSDYDCIVPKAAVRNDNGGDYVLVVKSKSSPLGNRYFASRVNVTKLAGDDSSVAISGEINPYDYVVLQSGGIVEDGKQVKLSSNEAM